MRTQEIFTADSLSTTEAFYKEQLSFSRGEEMRRRASQVLVKGVGVEFEKTPMGRMRNIVEPKAGFLMRVLGTLLAEISPGKRFGAHRHLYEDVNYITSGSGYSLIEDRRYNWATGDALCIPVFSWHQHFNTGIEPARFLVYHSRPLMKNLGFMHVEQGEWSDE